MQRVCARSVLVLLAAAVVVACGPKREDIQKTIHAGNLELLDPPTHHEVAAIGFADSRTAVLATWLEGEATAGALRFSAFDGKAWSAPVTVASNLDLSESAKHPPSVGELSDGSLQIRWFGHGDGAVVTPQVEVSDDHGATWRHWIRLPANVAPGEGPVAWAADPSEVPSVAYIKGYSSILQPRTAAACVTHPRLHLDGLEETYLDTYALPNDGISFVRFRGHGVVAFRAFASIESKTDGETNIELCDIDPTGLAQVTTGDHDGWDMPIATHGIGPVLATNGHAIAYAYYSARRKGYPAIIVWFGALYDSTQRAHAQRVVFPDGIAMAVDGDTSDLTMHYDNDTLVVLAVEDGKLIEHDIAGGHYFSFRLSDQPVRPSTTLLWSGALSGVSYIAGIDGGHVQFVRSAHPPLGGRGADQDVGGEVHGNWLLSPTPTPTPLPPTAEEAAATAASERTASDMPVIADADVLWPGRLAVSASMGVHEYSGWHWKDAGATHFRGPAFEIGARYRLLESSAVRVDGAFSAGYYAKSYCRPDSTSSCVASELSSVYGDVGPRITWKSRSPLFLFGQAGVGLHSARYAYAVAAGDPNYSGGGGGSTSRILPSAHALAGAGLAFDRFSVFAEAKYIAADGILPERTGSGGYFNYPVPLSFGGEELFFGVEVRQ